MTEAPPLAPGDLVAREEPEGSPAAFEKRLKREMGFSLLVAFGAFACAFTPLLAASLLAEEWSRGVLAWSLGGAFAVAAFLVGIVVGRRTARTGVRGTASRFLGAVLGLSSVAAGVLLVL